MQSGGTPSFGSTSSPMKGSDKREGLEAHRPRWEAQRKKEGNLERMLPVLLEVRIINSKVGVHLHLVALAIQ